ncbi:MAG: ParB/RepB/Spo0J family partition protein [Candidatus Heimdallarchaeota archaeon]
MSDKEQPLVESKGLEWLSPKDVSRNPQNPRLIFDEDSMKILRDSIAKVGILVPLLVYQRTKDGMYILLDGERRWLCALELKMEKMPVNIIAEPNLLTNILTMFNIHNVRERWEPMPTALKLEVLMRLLETKDNRVLAEHTGLSAWYVARCKRLLTFDKKYQDLMLLAAREERIKPDFFVELYPIFRLMKKYLPAVDKKYERNEIIDKFLEKYQKRVITDVIDFRQLSRMIRAIDKGASRRNVQKLTERLLEDPSFSIREAYDLAARAVYDIMALEKTCIALRDSLSTLEVDLVAEHPSLVAKLKELKKSIDQVLHGIE